MTVIGMPHYKPGSRDPQPPPSAAARLQKSRQAEIASKREAAPKALHQTQTLETQAVAPTPATPPVAVSDTPPKIAGLLMAPFELGPGSYRPIGRAIPSGPVIALPASLTTEYMAVAVATIGQTAYFNRLLTLVERKGGQEVAPAPVAVLSTWTASRLARSSRVQSAYRRSGLKLIPTGLTICLPGPLNPPEPEPEPVKIEITLPGQLSPSDRSILGSLLTSLADVTADYALGKIQEGEMVNHLSGYVKLARTLGNRLTRGKLERFDRAATEAQIAGKPTPTLAPKQRRPSVQKRAIADADQRQFVKSNIANANPAERERQRRESEVAEALAKADNGRRLARLVERLTGVILVDAAGSMVVAGDCRYWLKVTHTGADALLIERRSVRGPKEYEWLKSAEYTWNETTDCRKWLEWAEAEAKRRQAEQTNRAAQLRAKYQAQIAAGGIL